MAKDEEDADDAATGDEVELNFNMSPDEKRLRSGLKPSSEDDEWLLLDEYVEDEDGEEKRAADDLNEDCPEE